MLFFHLSYMLCEAFKDGGWGFLLCFQVHFRFEYDVLASLSKGQCTLRLVEARVSWAKRCQKDNLGVIAQRVGQDARQFRAPVWDESVCSGVTIPTQNRTTSGRVLFIHRVCQAGDDISERGQARINMLSLLKANAFRVCLVDTLRASQVHQDKPALEVFNLVGAILLVTCLVHIDVQHGMRATRSVIHRLTGHLSVD